MKPAEEGAPGWHGRVKPSLLPPRAPRLGQATADFWCSRRQRQSYQSSTARPATECFLRGYHFLTGTLSLKLGEGSSTNNPHLRNSDVKKSDQYHNQREHSPMRIQAVCLQSAPSSRPLYHSVEVKPETDSTLWPLA